MNPGDAITVNSDTTVTAKWRSTTAPTINNSVDNSTTKIVAMLCIADKRTGLQLFVPVLDETMASSFENPYNEEVNAKIAKAKEDMLKEAQNRVAGYGYAVEEVNESVRGPEPTETTDGRSYTYFDDVFDDAGDYYDHYIIIDGEYYHSWRITITLDAKYTSKAPTPTPTPKPTQKPTPTPTPKPTQKPTPTPKPTKGFSDVQDPKHPYYKAIYWAADAGITKGYSDGTFGINRACTRSEAVMFLWRMGGKPEPKNASKSPFKDVTKSHPHYKAILWAAQKGITKGYSDGTFGVNKTCTRGHIMTFVWRFKGQPAPKTVAKSPFTDVPKNHPYYKAILWGSQKKVTNGMGDGTYGIDLNCTRGQIVTFLYRIR